VKLTHITYVHTVKLREGSERRIASVNLFHVFCQPSLVTRTIYFHLLSFHKACVLWTWEYIYFNAEHNRLYRGRTLSL